MGDVTFRYDRNFLVAEFSDAAGIISYQEQMITSNRIGNILRADSQLKNGVINIYYDITSKLSLSRAMAAKKATIGQFIHFTSSFIKACKEVYEYQLVNQGILLDPEYIYINPATFEADFVYLPLYDADTSVGSQLAALKNILMAGNVELLDGVRVQKLVELFSAAYHSIEEFEARFAEVSSPAPVSPAMPKYVPSQQPYTPPQPPYTPPVVPPIVPTPPTAGGMPAVTTPEGKASPKAKRTTVSTNAKLVVGGVTIAGILLIGVLISLGLLAGDNGGLDITKVAAMFLVIAAADYFVYKKVAGGSGARAEIAATKEKKQKEKGTKAKIKTGVDMSKIPPSPGMHPQPPVSPPTPPPYQPPTPPPYQQPTPQPPYQQPFMQPATQPIGAFADTGGKTEVLMDEDSFAPYLEHYVNNIREKRPLPSRYRIGKLQGQVDYVSHSKKVSKVHAEFCVRDGKVFVTDLSSLNGIYINGSPERIQSNMEYEVHNNDKITIADDEFILRF